MPYLNGCLLALVILRLAWMLGRLRLIYGKPVTHGGELVHVRVTRDKSRVVSGVGLTIDMPDRLRFSVRRETFVDRFAKYSGVAREWQTGDEGFDAKVFIASEDPALLDAISSDAELRSLFTTLLQFQRRGSLTLDEGRLTVDVVPAEGLRDVSDSLVREQFAGLLYPTLAKVRERLARIVVGDWESDREPARRRKQWLVGLCAFLGLAGVAGFLVDLLYDDQQVVREMIPHYSGILAAATAAALLAATIAWLWRRPYTHVVVLDILLAALPGTWLASNAGLTWYNEQHDYAAPRKLAVQVENLYTTQSKNSTNRHLVVVSWPDSRGERHVLVNEREFGLMKIGGCVDVLWHRGRLGDGWVSGYELSDAKYCNGGMVE